MENLKYLKYYKTYDLCRELTKREGVEVIFVEPHAKSDIQQIEGPATIFIVTD